MELNTVTQSDFTKLANLMWVDAYASVPQIMRSSGLFQIDIIPKGTGDSREYSEIDLKKFAKTKDQGDQAERAQVQQGYTKTMTPIRVGIDIGITREMRDGNKYRDVTTRLLNLGQMVPERMDLDLAHRLTFGTATTYVNMDGTTVSITTGDGLQLFYSAHTLKGTASTYRNRLANNPKISKGALEVMERLVIEETLNQFGQKMNASFNVLWTTADPNSVNTAREYLRATADPESANSATYNAYRAKYTHLILPNVDTDSEGNPDSTKRFYWGLASTSTMVNTVFLGIWEEANMLTPDDLGKDSTENWNYGTRGRYGIAIVNGGWIKMSSGTGEA